MPKERDPFRKYVKYVDKNKWICNFCRFESRGNTQRIRAHLAGVPGYGIKACDRVDHLVRAEAFKTFNRKGRVFNICMGGTSGEGTEGTVFGASQSVLPSDDALNPNDAQNSNQLGCAPQQPSLYQPRAGTAPACAQDQVSLPPGDRPLDNLDNTQQHDLMNPMLDAAHGNENASSLQPLSYLYGLEFGTGSASACPQDDVSLPPGDMPLDATHGNENALSLQQRLMDLSASPFLYFSELLAHPDLQPHPESEMEEQNARGLSSFPNDEVCGNIVSFEEYRSLDEQFADKLTPDSQLHPTYSSNHHHSLLENHAESCEVIVNTSEEIQPNELHNPTVRSSLQIDSSLGVDGANRLQDCGQPCIEEVDPVRSNTSLTDTVQHPSQLPPRCDKEDGNDTRRFSSRIPMDIDPCMPSSSQALNNALPPPQHQPCGTGLIGPSSLPELDMNEGPPETSHPNTGSDLEEKRDLLRKLGLVVRKEADVMYQSKYATSRFLKKQRMEAANSLANEEALRNDCREATSEDCFPPHQCLDILMHEVEDLLRQGLDILMHEVEDLMRQGEGQFEVRETKVNTSFEDEMVGEVFQRNASKILEYLVANQKCRLGIYGMGGVGKTTIMVHIQNKLLKEANCGDVLWITVSKDFNTQTLQDAIAEELELDIPPKKDVRKQAKMLYSCFEKRGKSTVILDDVWESFDLKEVGIPTDLDGIKLVLTTRSFKVCNRMQCEEMIKIEPLSPIEAESLFLKEFGSKMAHNLGNKAVVKDIVKECAGLPLAIIMVARSMRGATNEFEWTDCLEKLRESNMGQMDMEKNVLKILELSYNLLPDHEAQQCFLSCALYPEDELISKFELIEFFIDQGLIGRLNTRGKQYARGLNILNQLKDACLLEDHVGDMKMHDLNRDMALHIMSATSIVKARKQLRTIPAEEYWTDALEKVSLMKNDIEEFPLNMSPNCPKLSTFLLNTSSLCDLVIPHSFFKHLWGLKVLNLSGCRIRELPDSISDLVNLTALLLGGCRELRRIPHLGKLRSLRKLDIFGCARVEALEGPEMLVNLRYLDIACTCIEKLPKGTLGALSNLQCLGAKLVNGEEITKLWTLETLICFFDNVDDFNKFVRVVSKRTNNPPYYKINVDREDYGAFKPTHVGALLQDCERSVNIVTRSHAIVSARGESSGSGGGICILIPQDVQNLTVWNCDGATNLSNVGQLENLEKLQIRCWSNLRVLCGGQDEELINIHDSPTPLLFRSLSDLTISKCPKLKYLFGHEPKFSLPHLRRIEILSCVEMVGITVAATSPPPYPPPAFLSLVEISVWECDKMKRVVESEWLPHFSNLQEIEVGYCKNMEEIIGGPSPYISIEEISPERLLVEGCHELPLHLLNFQTIQVIGCEGRVEMISGAGQGQEGSMTTPVNNTPSSSQSSISLPNLTSLSLYHLPQLERICAVPITCNSGVSSLVIRCPKLNGISSEWVQLLDFKGLPNIVVEGEEKWQTLIWDHPDALANLQSHLLFMNSYWILKGRRNSHELSI